MDLDDDVKIESIELDTLRSLAREIEDQPISSRSRRSIANLPIRTSRGRLSSRPVFVLDDPVVSEAVASDLPFWQPGGDLKQFEPLLDLFEITQVSPESVQIVGTENATPDVEATELFRAAVAQLREDLVRNDPAAATTLVVDWSTLESFDVLVCARLEAQVTPPKGSDPTVSGLIDAYADSHRERLFLTADDQLAAYDSGARAVASLFSSESRRIAQAWLAACATAEAGREARRLEHAEIRAGEEKRRQAKNLENLEALQAETASKPTVSARTRSSRNVKHQEVSDEPVRSPRQLVDPGELIVVNPDGEIVAGDPPSSQRRSKRHPTTGVEPVRTGKTLRSGASPREYTEVDKETVGLDLVRKVLRSSDEFLSDLRGQRGVGADAVDELSRFYELKVYAEDEPNEIRLEPSQIDRAKTTEGFFLVVVSNVESGHGKPRVRIITDPLAHLERIEKRAASFSGVRSAPSLIYELSAPDDSVGT